MNDRQGAGGVAGMAIGAIVLSILVTLIHAILIPTALADGQYVFFWIYTIPYGAVLGALTGVAVVSRDATERAISMKCSRIGGFVVIIMAGLWMVVILGMLAEVDRYSWTERWWSFRLQVPAAALSLLWASLLYRAGRRG